MPTGRNTSQISVIVNNEVLDKIEEMVEESGMSRSQVAAMLIQLGLDLEFQVYLCNRVRIDTQHRYGFLPFDSSNSR